MSQKDFQPWSAEKAQELFALSHKCAIKCLPSSSCLLSNCLLSNLSSLPTGDKKNCYPSSLSTLKTQQGKKVTR